jgi:pimeloyl-ACP methyl ester carboxylesterase
MYTRFEYYQAIPDDEVQNMNYSKTKIPLPVLGLGGGYTQAFGGNITMPAVIYGMDKVARNATGIVVPNSGHWIPEEQQKFLSEQLTKFVTQ